MLRPVENPVSLRSPALATSFVVLTLVLPTPVRGEPAADDLRQLLSASAARKFAEEWPELTFAVRDRLRAELGPASAAEVSRTVAERHGPEQLLDAVAAELDVDPETLGVVRTGLEEPAWRHAVALEEAASTPDGLSDQPLFLANERRRPASRRAVQVRRLEQALHYARNVLAVACAVSRNLNRGRAAHDCGSESGRESLARERMGLRAPRVACAETDRFAPDVRARARTTLLFTYRDLSEAQIAELARFAESPAGRAWFGAIRDALARVLAREEELLEQRFRVDRSERCAAGGARQGRDARATARREASP